jgi:hypothetical protein
MYDKYLDEIKSLDTLSSEQLSDKTQQVIERYVSMGRGNKFKNFGWIFSEFIGNDHFDWHSRLDSKKYALENVISLVSNQKIAHIAKEKGIGIEEITSVCLRLINFLTMLADEYSDYMELFALFHVSDYGERHCKIMIAEYLRKIYIAEIEHELDKQEEILQDQRKNQHY